MRRELPQSHNAVFQKQLLTSWAIGDIFLLIYAVLTQPALISVKDYVLSLGTRTFYPSFSYTVMISSFSLEVFRLQIRQDNPQHISLNCNCAAVRYWNWRIPRYIQTNPLALSFPKLTPDLPYTYDVALPQTQLKPNPKPSQATRIQRVSLYQQMHVSPWNIGTLTQIPSSDLDWNSNSNLDSTLDVRQTANHSKAINPTMQLSKIAWRSQHIISFGNVV